ncbi:putative aminopeptidase [Sphaerochaeta pleomorpha str. Grapes]|uniref:Putative aminopeptidase n=1 Tax=Sphaerochaeta pleomorpha (strain ATCC BAA-1885 / DSM 22778 / Grapes) TaxID=158190 RepID=G8QYW2_SPHPG|nr:M28 family peptidase [Sphaerochaeta pleomorpha]AEV29739.1 putative aminopeptidase [Sphaerochaeta pleomorpha str. Grapes]
MSLPLFNRKQQKKPPLVKETEKEMKEKIETLKAGRLASLSISLADKLISLYGPRISGSENARETASALEKELKGFCDTTEYKEFTLYNQAYTLWLKVLVVVYPFALALLWLGLPVMSLSVLLLFLWYVARGFIYFKPVGEKYTPKGRGANVHGVLEPKKEVLHTVIFSGHHDSARLYKYNSLDKLMYAKKVLVPLLLFVFLCIACLTQLFTELFTGKLFSFNLPPIPCIILNSALTFCFPFVLPLWGFVTSEGSPGAGDNLVSSCMGVELARFFDWRKRCGNTLEHTRLVFASFDGEEVGLKGSKQWFSEHKDLCNQAIQLNFDCPYYADEITFLDRDINGTQPLSTRLASRCVQIAKSMGYDASRESIPFLAGGTDAAEGSRSGIEACTLTAMAWDDVSKPAVYHTKDDVCSAIELKAIEQALSIAIRLVELVDAGTLYEKNNDSGPEEEEIIPELHFERLSKR